MGLTPEQYLPMLARLDKNKAREVAADACDDEGDIHDFCEQECRRRGWFRVSARMDKRSTLPRGTPDDIIFADRGRVFIVEWKSRQGKLSVEQTKVKAHLEHLGHAVHVFRNQREFLQLVNSNQPKGQPCQ